MFWITNAKAKTEKETIVGVTTCYMCHLSLVPWPLSLRRRIFTTALRLRLRQRRHACIGRKIATDILWRCQRKAGREAEEIHQSGEGPGISDLIAVGM